MGEVFRRQLGFRRKTKRLPLVLAKEGSSRQVRRPREKPVHMGTQW